MPSNTVSDDAGSDNISRFMCRAVLAVGVLGLLAHLVMLWAVVSYNTAGFAVELRNRQVVSRETAHLLGVAAHVVGGVVSVIVVARTLGLLRRSRRRFGLGLALLISIPAISPLSGLALPIGVIMIVSDLRARVGQETRV